MSDENLINSQNSVSTPPHKNLKDNLATLGQVKNVTDKIIKTANTDREQITKNKEDIGSLKEDIVGKIDKIEYEDIETNTKSLWSVGVIANGNIDVSSTTRLRTIPISIVGIINVAEGYEYAVVLLDSQKQPTSAGTYLAYNKKNNEYISFFLYRCNQCKYTKRSCTRCRIYATDFKE